MTTDLHRQFKLRAEVARFDEVAQKVAVDNAAKRALIPTGEVRYSIDESAEMLEAIDPVSLENTQQAACKTLELN